MRTSRTSRLAAAKGTPSLEGCSPPLPERAAAKGTPSLEGGCSHFLKRAAACATAGLLSLAVLAVQSPAGSGPAAQAASAHPPVGEGSDGELTPEKRRRLEESRARLKEALAKTPEDVELWRKLGFVHQALGEAAEARSAFERLLALRPEDEGAHFMTALIHEKMGNTAQAISAWEKCLRVAKVPKHREVAQRHLSHLRGEK